MPSAGTKMNQTTYLVVLRIQGKGEISVEISKSDFRTQGDKNISTYQEFCLMNQVGNQLPFAIDYHILQIFSFYVHKFNSLRAEEKKFLKQVEGTQIRILSPYLNAQVHLVTILQ